MTQGILSYHAQPAALKQGDVGKGDHLPRVTLDRMQIVLTVAALHPWSVAA